MHVIVITGPTASGKSALALAVAERLGCGIISADSRQVYRHIPITTAIPSYEERLRVPHYLIEFLELEETYSAAKFAEDALKIINESSKKGDKYIIVCGGSMMYIDALLYGLDDFPQISSTVRKRVNEMYEQIGIEGLLAYLQNLDPLSFSTVDMANPRRVIHKIELCLQAGKPISGIISGTFKDQSSVNGSTFVHKIKDTGHTYSKYMIEMHRDILFERINARVEWMVIHGMEDEARKVFDKHELNSLNTIGFKEWFANFDGLLDRHTAIERIKKNTRVYAKKQLTWLAKQRDVIRINHDRIEKMSDFIIKHL